MKYNSLSDEAKEVINGMIEYCLRHHICMGMGEGFRDHETNEKHDFRIQIENFVNEVSQ